MECLGVGGCASGVAALPPKPAWKPCPSAVGQQLSGFSNYPSSVDMVNNIMEADPEALDLGSPSLCQLESSQHSRGAADIRSWGRPPPGVWRLHPEVVGVIWEKHGKAAVDLFASEEMTHCPFSSPWQTMPVP